MLLGGSVRHSKVHLDKFKTLIVCDLATDCIKVQVPTEMASVTSLALATPRSKGLRTRMEWAGGSGWETLVTNKVREHWFLPLEKTLSGCPRAWFPWETLSRRR